MRPLLIVVLFVLPGCPPSEQASPATTNSPASGATSVEPDPLPTNYRAHTAYSVDLIDPTTGLPMPAELDRLEPTLLREVQRITSQPVLREALNSAAVRGTQWFERFENDLDQAAEALRASVEARHVPGTPLIRVYALDTLQTDANQDAQTILQALGEVYMRRHKQAIDASISERRIAAQRALDAAEDAVDDRTAALKRFLLNNPVSSSSIERSRLNALEAEALQRRLRQAELRRESALTKLLEIRQQTRGFLGYAISEEYPPQPAR